MTFRWPFLSASPPALGVWFSVASAGGLALLFSETSRFQACGHAATRVCFSHLPLPPCSTASFFLSIYQLPATGKICLPRSAGEVCPGLAAGSPAGDPLQEGPSYSSILSADSCEPLFCAAFFCLNFLRSILRWAHLSVSLPLRCPVQRLQRARAQFFFFRAGARRREHRPPAACTGLVRHPSHLRSAT